MLCLVTGAEQSEALAGVGVGPHTFAGVGANNKRMLTGGCESAFRSKGMEAAGFAPASENTSPQEYYDAYPLLNCRP